VENPSWWKHPPPPPPSQLAMGTLSKEGQHTAGLKHNGCSSISPICHDSVAYLASVA